MSQGDSGELSGPEEDDAEEVEGEIPVNEVREVAQQAAQQYLQVQASFHAGPLPEPKTFGSYEEILPGTAERIVTMTEKEQRERHHLQRVSLYASIGIRYLGMLFAAGLSLAALLIGASLIQDDKDIEGLVFLLAGLGPVIGAFLFRKNLPSPPSLPPEDGADR